MKRLSTARVEYSAFHGRQADYRDSPLSIIRTISLPRRRKNVLLRFPQSLSHSSLIRPLWIMTSIWIRRVARARRNKQRNRTSTIMATPRIAPAMIADSLSDSPDSISIKVVSSTKATTVKIARVIMAWCFLSDIRLQRPTAAVSATRIQISARRPATEAMSASFVLYDFRFKRNKFVVSD